MHRDRLLGADCRGYKHKTQQAALDGDGAQLPDRTVAPVHAGGEGTARHGRQPLRARHQAGRVERSRALPVATTSATRCSTACKASDSPDLYPFVLFALTTGARKGEITALEWPQVDLKRRWAMFPRTKNGDARGVPLTTLCAPCWPRGRATVRACSRSTSRRRGTRRSPRGHRQLSLPRSSPFVRLGDGAGWREPGRSRDAARTQDAADDIALSHVGNAGTTRLSIA